VLLTGSVLSFDKQKGFGFIKPDDQSEKVFVHFSAIQSSGYKTLEVGQRVNFVLVEGKKGPQVALVTIEEQ
jgi:CspA family cold shock protein